MEASLKGLYADIIKGYSRTFFRNQQVFVKHMTHLESAEIDIKYNLFLQKAISDKLPTYKEKESYLISEKAWSAERDREMSILDMGIKNLKKSRSKLFLEKDRNKLQEEIDNKTQQLNKIIAEKESLIGFVAERYANKKANEYYIFSTLYKDINSNELFYSEDEFNYLDTKDIDEIVNLYNLVIENFGFKNLKRIALFPPFFNLFLMANDDLYHFYGKALVDLTFYQVEIASHAKLYKKILNESKAKPPEGVLEDPDKLVDWFESSQAAEKQMSSNDNATMGGTSLVGAKASDYEKLGIEVKQNTVNFAKEAAKKGGTLELKDILKLHGL